MRKKVAFFLAGTAILLVLIGIRCFWSAKVAYRQAEVSISQGDWQRGILHLDQAIHWYFPGNPFVLKSVERLWNLGQELESKDSSLALLAYDSLRGGIYSIRSVVWPYQKWLPKVNDRIAHLRGAQEALENPQLSAREAYEKHLKLLDRDERPRVLWVILMGVGFLGWVGSVVGWIFHGFDREGHMLGRRSLPWMIGIVFFFALWVGSLLRA